MIESEELGRVGKWGRRVCRNDEVGESEKNVMGGLLRWP